jgi:hypothetical protein
MEKSPRTQKICISGDRILFTTYVTHVTNLASLRIFMIRRIRNTFTMRMARSFPVVADLTAAAESLLAIHFWTSNFIRRTLSCDCL